MVNNMEQNIPRGIAALKTVVKESVDDGRYESAIKLLLDLQKLEAASKILKDLGIEEDE